MELTYTWKLERLKKISTDSVQDAVIQTYWTLTGTDADGVSGTFSGATPFDINDVDPENFTPYEQLTEAQVLSWIQAVVVDAYKEHIDSRIIQQIVQTKQSVVEDQPESFPWNN